MEMTLENVEKVKAWLVEAAEKHKFSVMSVGYSPSPLGGVAMIVAKYNLSDLPLSLNISEKEIVENTEERLMTSVLPYRWKMFLISYRNSRRKHLRRTQQGKEGLTTSLESSATSDGSQIQTKQDGFVK